MGKEASLMSYFRLTLFISGTIIFGSCNSTVIDKFPDGTIKEECKLVNGKREGICTSYFEDGNIRSVCSYKNNVLNGVCKFYHHNGELNWAANFFNGYKNGQIDYYDSTGRKFQTSNFKDNELDGLSISYFEDGSIKERMTYKEGRLNGMFESFYKNKKLEMQVEYVNGDQVDFVVFDSIGNEIDHLIKYSVEFDSKKREYKIRILNPLYNLSALKVVDKREGEIEHEIYSTDYLIRYKTDKDTLRGYLFDIDTLSSERGVVKCSRYIEVHFTQR